jgi:histone-lysine N-methyltransferase EZH2
MSEVSTRDSSQAEENRTYSILSSRMDHPLCQFNGFTQGSVDKNHSNQDISSATSIKIPRVERLPPFTSWIFLDRCFDLQIDQ